MTSDAIHPLILAGRHEVRDERVLLRNPANGALLGEISCAGIADAEQACVAAARAFLQTRRLPSWKRSAILAQMAEAISTRAEDLARTIMREAAKPIADARKEVARALETVRVAAEEARRIHGALDAADWTPGNEGRIALTRRFPIGPILGVTPFNFPLNLVAHKVAPAIASGNPIIIKPAPQTPLSALRLATLAIEAGWPPQAISVLPCTNDVTAKLVEDERISMLSFTGSAAVGWRLKALVPRKRVTLELGGNAAVVVCVDADLDLATERIIAGGFGYAGQSCISVQRVYAHNSLHAALLERLHAALASWIPADPALESTRVGPMISAAAAQRAEEWIASAVSSGARLHCGGSRHGAYLAPALLSEVPQDSALCREEAFAPVVLVNSFSTIDEAFERVNASSYGLQAAIFTRSWATVARAWNELAVGAVLMDESSSWRADHLPYGGTKNSGVGKEGVRSAIEEMTEPRILLVPA